jgi:hypothetical protein
MMGVSAVLAVNDALSFGALPARCRPSLRPTSVKCPHYADAREHRWAVVLGDQQQRLHCGLPLFGRLTQPDSSAACFDALG